VFEKCFKMVELTASFVIKECRAIATFLNFYVSSSSTARFLRGDEKYYLFCR